ncbi:NLI_interacting factor-like phosphatase domain-containing protein [Hexamita inflata]|uniref:protein-serine/threonine phosphatase n=1 Tax=Hexamita inflata TaxID=28002 RepID=A0AA86QT24_9EUKA|nr:NLI interacting factor-like phosphatase domain-containing protein [Hexamita inflata]
MSCQHQKVNSRDQLCMQCFTRIELQQMQLNYELQGQFYINKSAMAKKHQMQATLLQKSNKYQLFLDIDNTMLEASWRDQKAASDQDRLLARFDQLQKENPESPWQEIYKRYYADISQFNIALFGDLIHIEMRPGMLDFLLATAPHLQINISTTGTTDYAQAILKVLDPLSKLFKQIIAREQQKTVSEISTRSLQLINDPILAQTTLKQFYSTNKQVLERTFAFDDNVVVWRQAECENVFKSIVFGEFNGNEHQSMTYSELQRVFVNRSYYDLNFLSELQLKSLLKVLQEMIHVRKQAHVIRNEVFSGRKFYFEGYPENAIAKRLVEEHCGEIITLEQYVESKDRNVFKVAFKHKYEDEIINQFTEHVKPKMKELIAPNAIQNELTKGKGEVSNIHYLLFGETDDREELTEIREFFQKIENVVDEHFIVTSCYLFKIQDQMWWQAKFMR